jgi:flagellar biosynthetic protein FliQ
MESFAVSIAQKGLLLVLTLSAAPVLAAMTVGLCVSLLQATTQIQEQTLTFVPKLVAVVLVLAFLGRLGMQLLIQFAGNLFETFPQYIN